MREALLRVRNHGLFEPARPSLVLSVAQFCLAYVDEATGRVYWKRHRTDGLFSAPVLEATGAGEVDPRLATSDLHELIAELAQVDAWAVSLVFVKNLSAGVSHGG